MIQYLLTYGLILFYVIIVASYLTLTSRPIHWEHVKILTTEDLDCDLENPDCPPSFHCFPANMIPGAADEQRGICIRLQDNLTSCNEATGKLILEKLDRHYVLKCVCKYPRLVTQIEDGADCNIDITCQPHGKLKDLMVDPQLEGECDCDSPYVALHTSRGPRCVFPKEKDAPNCHPGRMVDGHASTCDCPNHFISSDSYRAQRIFSNAYLNQFAGKPRCIPEPCKFNALNMNQVLEYARLEGKKCFCDPNHGNFGVFLESENYLKRTDNARHHNACANVYKDEPKTSVDHELFCFFYYKDLKPQCYIKFKNLHADSLNVRFTNGQQTTHKTLFVEDPWPDNAFSCIFENGLISSARVHKAMGISSFHCIYYENVYQRYITPLCRDLKNVARWWVNDKSFEYNTIFSLPVCLYVTNSEATSNEYDGKYILNPLHLSKLNEHNLYRTNGVLIYPDKYNNNFYTVQKYPMSKSDFQTAYERKGNLPILPQMDNKPQWRRGG